MKTPALILVCALFGCDDRSHRGSGERTAAAEPTPPGVTRTEDGEPAGLHRYRRWSDRIGQGAQPAGEVAFANLRALGFKAILTVDGAVPPVALAAKYGLRYIHVPIGYDGIKHEQAKQIVQAVAGAEGPVYVHCHHGTHRGPAAAMLARRNIDGISREEAVAGLTTSGTSPKYEGLWRDVRKFEPLSEAVLATVGPLPSKVAPAGVQATMVEVSTRWEHLKRAKADGWQGPEDNPDIAPPHEARMLWELYRESARQDDSKRKGEQFMALLAAGEQAAIDLEKALRKGDHDAAGRAYKLVKANCNACHADFRD